MPSDEELRGLLMQSKTIAVVGCSRDPEKPANQIPAYMQEHGYKIFPINPSADRILGEKAFKTLSDVKQQIDLVNVFRPSEEAVAIVKEAAKVGAKAVWLQLGIESKEAEKIARRHGILYVANKCIMVEHRRLLS
jgi:predicted CoA-binding protein